MTEDKNTSQPAVRFRSGAEGDWKPNLVARFAFAPEKPQPGLPGKNPGDLIVVGQPGGQEVLVSLGKAEQFSLEMVRRAAGLLGKWLAGSGAEELAIDLDSLQAAGGKLRFLTWRKRRWWGCGWGRIASSSTNVTKNQTPSRR